ncbi:MAG TPA: ECF transporter S component [Patescibacteria group bacterium]|nr:ECF transporter S component [Patescibacteria group bacterium]
MKVKRRMNIRDIVYVGMLAAMCAIATSIKIPFGVGAMVHLGSAFLYTVGIVFGGMYAGLAGAIGSAFFDIMMGFSPYTIWSFFIKGIAGVIVGTVAKGFWPEVMPGNRPAILRALLGCLLAAAWTLGGYTLAWWQVTGSLAVAFGNMPSSLLTSGAGLAVAVVLAPKLRKMMDQ